MEIHVVVRKLGREYVNVIVFDPAETLAVEGTWLRDLLERWSRSTKLAPTQQGDAARFREALRTLSRNEEWASIVRRHPAEIPVESLLRVFRAYEDELARAIRSGDKQNRSVTFRRHVSRYLMAHPSSPQFRRLPGLFRSVLSKRYTARPLISDLPTHPNCPPREPLGAIGHTSVADLQQQIKERLQFDLRQIEDACIREFNIYTAQLRWLEDVRSTPLSAAEIAAIDKLVDARERRLVASVEQVDARRLLSRYLKYVDTWKSGMAKAPGNARCFHDAKRLVTFAKSALPNWTGSTSEQLLYMAHIGQGSLVVVCLLLLQMHTGWNTSAVLGLTTEDVHQSEGRLILQGYKSKTDDHTPLVVVGPEDRHVHRAIEFLTNRLLHLKRLGRANPSENTLWHATLRVPRRGGNIISGTQRLLSEFQDRNRLPKFSLEQIRTQTLAVVCTSEGGIDAARRVAGHRRISTTAHYLDQVLFARLNSSINLEFQKRLERSVKYSVGQVSLDASSDADGLLYPIGDGASCANPHTPPSVKWLRHGLCAAEHCHQESGCANRRLVVDRDRLKEIVLSTHFYERNWNRLANENQEAFAEKHLPAMMFSFAMHGIVSRGPYGFLVDELTKELRDEV